MIQLVKESILEDIKKIGFNDLEFKKAIDFIKLLERKSYYQSKINYSYVQLPRTYLIKRYGNQYSKIISRLFLNDIILCNKSYLVGSYSKSYMLNNKYLDSNNKNTHYIKCVTINDTKLNKALKIKELEFTKNALFSLLIDYKKLDNLIDYHINKLSIKDFETNYDIKENVFEVSIIDSNFCKKHYSTKLKAIEKAKSLNKILIKDRSNFYISDAEYFIKLKKDAYLTNYKASLWNLHKKIYFINRNATNQRLDSNITNMCSLLMNQISIDNDLKQIDLKNSQFAILAHILPRRLHKFDDVMEFINKSQNGSFYELIQAELNIECRKKAKQITFEILFSSENNKSIGLKMMRERFPNLMQWIDEYKSKNGYEQFSIMLQKKESEIFIDGIYNILIAKNIWSLTKHDSVLCKAKDYEKVLHIINKHFKKIKFTGQLN